MLRAAAVAHPVTVGGMNDHANDCHMEELVQKVLASGKIPVVPHMPWSDSAMIGTEGPLIDAALDALDKKVSTGRTSGPCS